MVYVVIACHFRTRTDFCLTTDARLFAVYRKAKEGDRILVTGDVPYEHVCPTLGKLMRDWLVADAGLPKNTVSVLDGGVGTFSEARIACKLLKDEKKITVISSPWYHFAGKPIWRRRAQENDIGVSFISVPHTGGWRTWLTYAAIGIIVRVAIWTGLEGTLERRLTAAQTKRRLGFTFDGCK